MSVDYPRPKRAELSAFDPLKAEEREPARALGEAIRKERTRYLAADKRVSQRLLALAAGMSVGGLAKIEQGVRRTRASTLRRIADALAVLRPGLGDARELLAHLLRVSNGMLAAEPRCLPTSKRTKVTVPGRARVGVELEAATHARVGGQACQQCGADLHREDY